MTDLTALLAAQRDAQLAEGPPSIETRIDRMQRVLDLLKAHGDALCDAMRMRSGAYRPYPNKRYGAQGAFGDGASGANRTGLPHWAGLVAHIR